MENDFNLEELEELDLDSETSYEVWALGFDSDNNPTAHDYLLDSFSDPDSAVTFADSITVSEIAKVTDLTLGSTEHFSIEIETVAIVDDSPMNLGTIYRRTIYYNSITADVAITHADYELLEDGSIKIHFNKLDKFKNKETINVLFADEINQPILTIKIIGEWCGEPHENYFVCELVF